MPMAIILRYIRSKADWWVSVAHYNREVLQLTRPSLRRILDALPDRI